VAFLVLPHFVEIAAPRKCPSIDEEFGAAVAVARSLSVRQVLARSGLGRLQGRIKLLGLPYEPF
jgi:hypothetical protein